MRNLVVVIAIVLLGRTASAQPPGETPVKKVERKSLASAYLITIAATAVPVAISAIGAEDGDGRGAAVFGVIGVAGMVLGPSAGHWYAGERVTTGLVLRVGAAGAVVALAVNDPQLEHPAPTLLGLLAAVALWETGVIWDAVTLPRAVRRYNRAHQLAVTPLVTGDGPTTGVAVAGTF